MRTDLEEYMSSTSVINPNIVKTINTEETLTNAQIKDYLKEIDNLKQQITELASKNTQLQKENQILKNKLKKNS